MHHVCPKLAGDVFITTVGHIFRFITLSRTIWKETWSFTTASSLSIKTVRILVTAFCPAETRHCQFTQTASWLRVGQVPAQWDVAGASRVLAEQSLVTRWLCLGQRQWQLLKCAGGRMSRSDRFAWRISCSVTYLLFRETPAAMWALFHHRSAVGEDQDPQRSANMGITVFTVSHFSSFLVENDRRWWVEHNEGHPPPSHC